MLLEELDHYFTFNLKGDEMFEGISQDLYYVQGKVLADDELEIHQETYVFLSNTSYANRREFAMKHNLIKREG